MHRGREVYGAHNLALLSQYFKKSRSLMRLCARRFLARRPWRAENNSRNNNAAVPSSFPFSFISPLTADAVSFPEYLCHGTWVENDTAYLVASTDVGRYCLVYSASAATTGSRELSVTGHLASCPRASHRYPVSWQVNLTSYGEHC